MFVGVKNYFLNFIDPRISRSGGNIISKCVDRFRASLNQRFNPAVLEIFNITTHLMPGRNTLRKKSETNTLNHPSDKIFACDHSLKTSGDVILPILFRGVQIGT